MNYQRYLNPISLGRRPSALRVLTAILAKSPPSMISLAGGLPNPNLFPFESADITLKTGAKIHLDKEKMSRGLQYGPSNGQADLLKWLLEMQKKLHKPPTLSRSKTEGGLDMCVTVGSQDGLCKSFEMFVNPGDNVIIESPTYSGTLAILKPMGCNLLTVDTDQHGLQPDKLQQLLSKWNPEDAKNPESDIPRILYVIPNGGNPTGVSLTLDRKQKIYQMARKYDLLIMEDDPYYFLQYGKREPSFLELDVDGRVMRYDSFSKVISSGLRIGLVTGPGPLVERIVLHMQASVLHTSTMSQLLLSEVLHHWGFDGFMEHCDKVVDFYKTQKHHMTQAAEKHLKGFAEWNEPSGGMFLWIKLLGFTDTKHVIEEKAIAKEVLLVPGCVFNADSSKPSPYVRASYSLATKEQMDQAMARLAELIKEELPNQKLTYQS